MKKLNTLAIICLVFFVFGSALLTASAPATAQPTGPKGTVVKTRVLKAVSYVPMTKTDPTMVLMQMFMDKVNERAHGAVRIEFTGSTEVIPATDQMGALSKGIIDILNTPTYHKDAVPEVRACELSELTPAQERANGFFDIIVEAMKKRMKTIPLGRLCNNSPFFIYTNVKVQKLEDFKGLKFRSNVSYDEFFKRLGIVRVAMTPGEIYTAMERKMIVGFSNPRYISRYALQEITKYRVDHPWWFGGPNYLYVNQKLFESFPADLQKIMIDSAIEVEQQIPTVQFPLDQAEDKLQIAAGMEFIKLTPPDGKKLVETAHQVIWDIVFKAVPDIAPKLKELVTKKP